MTFCSLTKPLSYSNSDCTVYLLKQTCYVWNSSYVGIKHLSIRVNYVYGYSFVLAEVWLKFSLITCKSICPVLENAWKMRELYEDKWDVTQGVEM